MKIEREELEKLVSEGKSRADIAIHFDITVFKLDGLLKKYDLSTRKRRWNEEEIIKAIGCSISISEVLRKLGLSIRPGNYTTVRQFSKKNNIDITHLTDYCNRPKKKVKAPPKKAKPLEEILVENSSYARNHLKKRLLDGGLLLNVCSICDLSGVWNGSPIKMILDHINGVNDDNRIDNLRMLCPNCNSQQETFCVGNRKKVVYHCSCGKEIQKASKKCTDCFKVSIRKVPDRPFKEELEKMMRTMSWVAIGERYGVSDNSIRRWARNYKLI